MDSSTRAYIFSHVDIKSHDNNYYLQHRSFDAQYIRTTPYPRRLSDSEYKYPYSGPEGYELNISSHFLPGRKELVKRWKGLPKEGLGLGRECLLSAVGFLNIMAGRE
jgi:hypothetical protein